jgi:hypothetical protein
MKERERDESPKRENQPHQAQKGALLLLLLLLACFFIIIYSSSTNWVAYMEGNMGNWAFMGKISFGMERNRKRQTNQLFLLFLIQHITYSTYLCLYSKGRYGREALFHHHHRNIITISLFLHRAWGGTWLYNWEAYLAQRTITHKDWKDSLHIVWRKEMKYNTRYTLRPLTT